MQIRLIFPEVKRVLIDQRDYRKMLSPNWGNAHVPLPFSHCVSHCGAVCSVVLAVLSVCGALPMPVRVLPHRAVPLLSQEDRCVLQCAFSSHKHCSSQSVLSSPRLWFVRCRSWPVGFSILDCLVRWSILSKLLTFLILSQVSPTPTAARQKISTALFLHVHKASLTLLKLSLFGC